MPAVKVTDVILRDAHQSLIATRMRTEDMLPVCEQLNSIGYWSLEVWGGATFDACLRYLKEDPWQRLEELRVALPNTRLQMLLRGQNLLGYRHYSDDVVRAFIARAAETGMDVFRIFDALNDTRNLQTAIEAYTPLYQLFLRNNDFWRAANSLQLDETIGIYVAKLLGSPFHLFFSNNRHPIVPLSTLRAGFRLMLHGLAAEQLHYHLRQWKRGEFDHRRARYPPAASEAGADMNSRPEPGPHTSTSSV